MKILIQGDLFMRAEVMQACLEEALCDLEEPLDFDTIFLPTPTDENLPLSADDLCGDDTWNKPSGGDRTVYEFHGPIDLLVGPVKDVDYLVMHTAAVTREVLQSAGRLRALACCRGGPVNVDVASATDLGIPIVNAPGRNAKAVAEFIIAMMLTEIRSIARGRDGLKEGRWMAGLYDYDAASPGLENSVVGMVGLGRVGQHFATLAKAFKVNLLSYDPYVDAQTMAQLGVEKVDSLDELIPQADFLVITARHTPETDGLIGARELAMMKPTAYLVNTARGGLLDYDALYSVLLERRIKGAILDVFASEPPPADNPLLRMDNVLLTPHIAGATQETVYTAGRTIAGDIRRMALGERPLNCLNAEVFAR